MIFPVEALVVQKVMMSEIGLYEKGDQAPRRTIMIKEAYTFEDVLKRLREAKFPLDSCDGFRIIRTQEMRVCQDLPKEVFPKKKLYIANVRVRHADATPRIPTIMVDDGVVFRKTQDTTSKDFHRCLKIQDIIPFLEMNLINTVTKWDRIPEEANNTCEAYIERIKEVVGVI